MYFLEEEESYGEDEISILIQEAVNDPINNDMTWPFIFCW